MIDSMSIKISELQGYIVRCNGEFEYNATHCYQHIILYTDSC